MLIKILLLLNKLNQSQREIISANFACTTNFVKILSQTIRIQFLTNASAMGPTMANLVRISVCPNMSSDIESDTFSLVINSLIYPFYLLHDRKQFLHHFCYNYLAHMVVWLTHYRQPSPVNRPFYSLLEGKHVLQVTQHFLSIRRLSNVRLHLSHDRDTLLAQQCIIKARGIRHKLKNQIHDGSPLVNYEPQELIQSNETEIQYARLSGESIDQGRVETSRNQPILSISNLLAEFSAINNMPGTAMIDTSAHFFIFTH